MKCLVEVRSSSASRARSACWWKAVSRFRGEESAFERHKCWRNVEGPLWSHTTFLSLRIWEVSGTTTNEPDIPYGAGVTFVGRPFPLAEAEVHLARLRAWGLTFVSVEYSRCWWYQRRVVTIGCYVGSPGASQAGRIRWGIYRVYCETSEEVPRVILSVGCGDTGVTLWRFLSGNVVVTKSTSTCISSGGYRELV